MKKRAIVIHSGGMDSSICLVLAIREFGAENVLSLAFRYGQRHAPELEQAKIISEHFGVDHVCVDVNCFTQLTKSALLDPNAKIVHEAGKPPNTIVLGRNGFMMRMAAIYGHELGAEVIYTGIIEVESANSGYRDCSRKYADLMQEVLRLDLDNPRFEIRTPVVFMTKKETMELADRLGVLDYLLKNTITCYEGLRGKGCEVCPACLLRNEGIRQYRQRDAKALE